MHGSSMSRVVSASAVRLLRAVPRPAGLALAAVVGAAGLVAGAPAPALAATTATFTYTGAEQTYPVPAGAIAVTVTAIGAPGGFGLSGGAPGGGAKVTATVPLPGDTTLLYVEVGGEGASGASTLPALGGFNGGGTAGAAGGAGGGASDVRTTSIATVADSALTTANDSRLVVAGGGGGGAATPCGGHGGNAGDTSVTGPGNGGDGGTGNCAPQLAVGADGGFGGNAGGTAGTMAPCSDGSSSLGQGGSCVYYGSGAGGGGYYGGGAGGGGTGDDTQGAGGAGSSFWVTGATNTSMSEDKTAVPEVTITPVFAPLKVTTTSLPAATGGQSYTAPALAATGGEPPYTWSVTSGSLPPGLTLDSSTGVISGTPDVTGTYDFTVTATDSESPAVTANKALSISVSGPVITGLTPDHGPSFGGALVEITGTGLSCPRHEGFSCRASVTFGSHRAFVLFASPTAIWVIAPPGHGTVQVTVKVGGVSSEATTAGLFTYWQGRFFPF